MVSHVTVSVLGRAKVSHVTVCGGRGGKSRCEVSRVTVSEVAYVRDEVSHVRVSGVSGVSKNTNSKCES